MTTASLREVCDVIMGQAPPGTTYNSSSAGVPMIAGASDFGSRFPAPKRYTTSPTRLSEPGDILLCIRATIGDRNLADRQYCLGRGVASLRPNRDRLDAGFLWHWLEAIRPALEAKARGSTFPQVSRLDIESLPIRLPLLSEQRRLSRMLDSADSLLHKHRVRMESLEQLLQSDFERIANLCEKDGGPSVPIGSLAEVQSGLQVNASKGKLDRQVPYLRVANVFADRLELQEIKLLEVTDDEVLRTLLVKGDLLIVEGHGNRAQVGRCAVWDGSINPCVHQNHLIRARLDPSRAHPDFVSAFLNSPRGRSHVLRLCKTTSGLNTISANNIRSIQVLLPPMEAQLRFARVKEAVERCRRHTVKAIGEAERLIGSLMQQLV